MVIFMTITKKELSKEEEKTAVIDTNKSEKKKAEPKKHEKKKAEPKKHEEKKTEQNIQKTSEAERVKKKKIPKRKKSKVVLAKGKRKEAVARVVVSPGKGRFVFNRMPFSTIPNRFIREIVSEPLNFVGQELHSININVYVRGGGQMGQAQAARTAITKALVEYLGDDKLKNTYLEYDRTLLVDDVRRVEPKKYKGPKARARFQKSYR